MATTVPLFVLPGSPYTVEYYENKYKSGSNRLSVPKRIKPSKTRQGRTSIAHQIEYATQKYQEAIITYMNGMPTDRKCEEVWAWETFSQQVLPCLKFLDE
jgi:hypothetical protein